MNTCRTPDCGRFHVPLHDIQLGFIEIEAGRLNQQMRLRIKSNPGPSMSPYLAHLIRIKLYKHAGFSITGPVWRR